MKLQFYYDKENPSYEPYQKLIEKTRKMSDDFYSLDDVFYSKSNYDLIKKYEKHKMIIIDKMFKEINSYFPHLKTEACAIYLNGSYARGNITAGSDVDLTFYFGKKDASKYQSTIYLIRYAIATMLKVNVVHVHSFATYLRWYYIDNNLENVPITLNLDELFNYKYSIVNNRIIDKSYCYFRFIISRIEIWAKKYNHHFEHRSNETIEKKI